MISISRLAECSAPRQLGSSAPRKDKSVSTAKVLRERIKRNDDERLPRFLDCRKWKTTARKWKTTARPRKTLRQPETTTGPRKTRAQEETSPGPPADVRPLGHRSCGGAPPRPRPTLAISARTWIRAAKQMQTHREESFQSGRRFSKARAREEPSPGPPASETDARPLGHQPRGGAPPHPRFSRGQEGST